MTITSSLYRQVLFCAHDWLGSHLHPVFYLRETWHRAMGRSGTICMFQPEGPQYVICCARSVRNASYVFASYLSTRSLAFCTAVHVGVRPKEAALHFAAADRRATRSRRGSG